MQWSRKARHKKKSQKNLRKRRGNADKYTHNQILNHPSFLWNIYNFILRKRVKRGKRIVNTTLPAATVNNKYQVVTKSLDRAVIRNWSVWIHHSELCRRKSKMSVLKFAEEFTRLIIRYTRTSSPNVSIRVNQNHYSK